MPRRPKPADPYLAALWDVERLSAAKDMVVPSLSAANMNGRSLMGRQRMARLMTAGPQRLFVLRLTQTLAERYERRQKRSSAENAQHA